MPRRETFFEQRNPEADCGECSELWKRRRNPDCPEGDADECPENDADECPEIDADEWLAASSAALRGVLSPPTHWNNLPRSRWPASQSRPLSSVGPGKASWPRRPLPRPGSLRASVARRKSEMVPAVSPVGKSKTVSVARRKHPNPCRANDKAPECWEQENCKYDYASGCTVLDEKENQVVLKKKWEDRTDCKKLRAHATPETPLNPVYLVSGDENQDEVPVRKAETNEDQGKPPDPGGEFQMGREGKVQRPRTYGILQQESSDAGTRRRREAAAPGLGDKKPESPRLTQAQREVLVVLLKNDGILKGKQGEVFPLRNRKSFLEYLEKTGAAPLIEEGIEEDLSGENAEDQRLNSVLQALHLLAPMLRGKLCGESFCSRVFPGTRHVSQIKHAFKEEGSKERCLCEVGTDYGRKCRIADPCKRPPARFFGTTEKDEVDPDLPKVKVEQTLLGIKRFSALKQQNYTCENENTEEIGCTKPRVLIKLLELWWEFSLTNNFTYQQKAMELVYEDTDWEGKPILRYLSNRLLASFVPQDLQESFQPERSTWKSILAGLVLGSLAATAVGTFPTGPSGSLAATRVGTFPTGPSGTSVSVESADWVSPPTPFVGADLSFFYEDPAHPREEKAAETACGLGRTCWGLDEDLDEDLDEVEDEVVEDVEAVDEDVEEPQTSARTGGGPRHPQSYSYYEDLDEVVEEPLSARTFAGPRYPQSYSYNEDLDEVVEEPLSAGTFAGLWYPQSYDEDLDEVVEEPLSAGTFAGPGYPQSYDEDLDEVVDAVDEDGEESLSQTSAPPAEDSDDAPRDTDKEYRGIWNWPEQIHQGLLELTGQT